MYNFSKKTIDRFSGKVDFKYLDNGELDYDSCWTWLGTIGNKGYGQFNVSRKNYVAHRLAYMLTTPDENIDDLLICHSCDNPGCVNPNHLWSGTHIDNMIDRDNKGRTLSGEQCSFSILTESMIRNIFIDIYNDKYTTVFQIADDYNIIHHTIHNVLLNRVWKKEIIKILKELNTTLDFLSKKVLGNYGERSHYSKLKEKDVVEIKKLLKIGNASQSVIAKQFNISKNAISSINVGNTWKHV